MKKVKLVFLLVCASLFLSSLCWAADPPRSPGSPLPSGLTSPFPPSGTLSNGLKVDSNGYLLINAGGASGTSLTNGLKIDSSGNLLVDCATGCSTASGTITGVTAGTGLTGGGSSGSVTLNVAAATSSTLGGVEPDGTSILNSSGAISVTKASVGLGNVTNNAQVTGVTAGTGLTGGGTGGSLTLNVNWAAPGAGLGSTTPQSGAFTTLSATGGITAVSDGVHAGISSFVGNTTNPAIPSNSFGFIGPNSASFTSYFLQPSTTAPSGTQYLGCGTPSSGVSACSWGSLVAPGANSSITSLTGLTTPLTAGQGGTGVANTATLTLGSSNQNYATLGSGIVYNTTTTGALSDATSAQILAACSGCAPLTSPSFTTPALGAATATSLLATGIVDGTAPVTITTGSTANLGATYNSGYTFNQEGTPATAVTYTLPTAAAGKWYCIANSNTSGTADTGVLRFSTSAAGQTIEYNGTIGISNGYLISGGAAGDKACVVGINSTQWEAYAQTGVWTVH